MSILLTTKEANWIVGLTTNQITVASLFLVLWEQSSAFQISILHYFQVRTNIKRRAIDSLIICKPIAVFSY